MANIAPSRPMFAPYNGYLRFSTTAVFLYDWALTAEDEVETIWKQNMSITKVFFVILRYGTLALKSMDLWTATTSGISDEVCSIVTTAGSAGLVLIMVTIQVILQMRIYAMYNRSRRLRTLNALLFAIEIGSTTYLLVRLHSERLAASENVIGSCYYLVHKSTGYGWLAPLVFELYMATLALVRVLRDRRSLRDFEKEDILTVLVRDSVAYFFLIALAMAAAVGLFFSSRLLGATTDAVITAFAAIGGARLILSTRRIALLPSGSTTAVVSTHLGFIEDNPPPRRRTASMSVSLAQTYVEASRIVPA